MVNSNEGNLFSRLKATWVHICFATFWVLMTIPTLLFWSDSVAVVLIYSIYALVVGHVASYQAANSAGVDEATHKKLNAIAEGLADLMEALECQAETDTIKVKLGKSIAELRDTVGLEDE